MLRSRSRRLTLAGPKLRDSLPLVTGSPTSSLLVQLNDARKSVAYGDIAMPHLDPEDIASEIEEYVGAVEAFLAR